MQHEDPVELYHAALERLVESLRATAPPAANDPRWDELKLLILARHGYAMDHLVFYGTVARGTRDRARRLFLSLWDAARTASYPKRAWMGLEGAIFGHLNRFSDEAFEADFD